MGRGTASKCSDCGHEDVFHGWDGCIYMFGTASGPAFCSCNRRMA